MRRKDFEISDLNKANIFLDIEQDGALATLTKDKNPVIRPMNFVRVDDQIYFHGARTGEKIEGLGQNASLSVYKSLSLIPSYWSDELNASPATALFQSVVVKGAFGIVESVQEKVLALQKFMEKLQPEGKYLPFNDNLDFYKKDIDYVSVFVLNQTETSYKVKLGQNWNAEKRDKIRNLLIQRGTAVDLETVKLMEEFGLF